MFEKSVKFTEKNHLFVFHDYAHGTIAFDEQKVSPSLMSAQGAKRVGIELFSFSKIFFAPDSTFYLWVNTPKQIDGVDFFKQLLTEKKIATMPSIGFGEGNRKFYRLSLVQSEKIIDETTKK